LNYVGSIATYVGEIKSESSVRVKVKVNVKVNFSPITCYEKHKGDYK